MCWCPEPPAAARREGQGWSRGWAGGADRGKEGCQAASRDWRHQLAGRRVLQEDTSLEGSSQEDSSQEDRDQGRLGQGSGQEGEDRDLSHDGKQGEQWPGAGRE